MDFDLVLRDVRLPDARPDQPTTDIGVTGGRIAAIAPKLGGAAREEMRIVVNELRIRIEWRKEHRVTRIELTQENNVRLRCDCLADDRAARRGQVVDCSNCLFPRHW